MPDAMFLALFTGGYSGPAVPPDNLLLQLIRSVESHVLLLRDVGHLGFLEAPDQTRQAVLDFAAGVLSEQRA